MPSKLSSSFFLSILLLITAPCLAGQLVQYQSQPTAEVAGAFSRRGSG